MHSTHSYDGSVPLVELKKLLKAQGISFCCMTEHTDTLDEDTARAAVAECRALSDETFLFVPGFEVPYKHTHVLMIGATEFVSQKADITKLRKWAENARFIILAHPQRNRFEVDNDLLSIIDGLEIWNQQYDGKKVPRLRSLDLLTHLRLKKSELLATGGVDLHRKEHIGMPTISLEVSDLSETSIGAVLKEGQYTFGGDHRVPSRGVWQTGLTPSYKMKSRTSTAIIFWGKKVNAFFALFGLRLPKGLRQLIRARI